MFRQQVMTNHECRQIAPGYLFRTVRDAKALIGRSQSRRQFRIAPEFVNGGSQIAWRGCLTHDPIVSGCDVVGDAPPESVAITAFVEVHGAHQCHMTTRRG